MLDLGSHLAASINGWTHPLSREALYSAALLARVTNALRDPGSPEYVPDWPWKQDPETEEVTPEERAQLTAQLQASSAFGQLRTEAASSDNS